MRATDNPDNPFHRSTCTYDEQQPVHRHVREEHARSILNSNDSPDIPFRWSVNPYRGCTHGCAYCYARRTHEYLDRGAGTDFESFLTAKLNAAELLERALARRSWQRERIAFSGVTDCYQPLEAKYRITRACLEVCRRLANPASIVTKSTLVLRDIDLLTNLDRICGAPVLLSIAFADEHLARLIEPGAPPPRARFAALRRLREAGLPVGVLIAPVIPGLNDRSIPTLMQQAADCGAQWAAITPVRLPGHVADVFLARLRTSCPDAAAHVEQRIREMRGGRLNNPNSAAE